MSLKLIPLDEIFSAGASLWILPTPQKSAFAAEVDWYLNFQIAQAKKRELTPLTPELLRIAKEHEIPIAERPDVRGQPLLIASSFQLPADQVIEIDAESSNEWTKKTLSVWKDLGSPTLRVFLPQGMTPDQFKKGWGANSMDEVSVFADPTKRREPLG